MTFFQRFYVLIAAVLCVAVWAFSYFILHAPQGLPRLLWIGLGIAVFVLVCVLGDRSQGRS